MKSNEYLYTPFDNYDLPNAGTRRDTIRGYEMRNDKDTKERGPEDDRVNVLDELRAEGDRAKEEIKVIEPPEWLINWNKAYQEMKEIKEHGNRIQFCGLKEEVGIQFMDIITVFCQDMPNIETRSGIDYFLEWEGKIPPKLAKSLIWAGIYWAIKHPETLDIKGVQE